jgi:hypothetical protein
VSTLPTSTRGLLDEVATELAAQDARWGVQSHPDGTGPYSLPLVATSPHRVAHSLVKSAQRANDADVEAGSLTWRGILLEEVLEAFAEPAGSATLRAELVQVAAVAAQWVAALDRKAAA